jgi:hypothetical protein
MLNKPGFEEEYLDILQNIEMAVVSIFNQHLELIDFNVETALQTLIKTYRGEARGRIGKPPANQLAAEVYTSMKTMCDWRLGRELLSLKDDTSVDFAISPVSVDEIITCLQRIRRSLKRWSKQGGRQGYFYFVSKFVG